MTKDEWLTVEVGDFLIERTGVRRQVLTVSRVFGKRGQRGQVRTTVHVPGIKTFGTEIIFTSSEDVPKGGRWRLEKRAGGSVVRMDPITIKNIRSCARCGGDHTEVRAMPLHRSFSPPEAGGIIWTHWAPCPTNGDPILFMTNAVMRHEGSAAIPEGPGMPAVIPLSVSAEEYDAELKRVQAKASKPPA